MSDPTGFASALILGTVAPGIGVTSMGSRLAPAPLDFGPATVVARLGELAHLTVETQPG